MKQLLQILSFLMLLIILTAEDCSYGSAEMSKQQIQNEMFQSIEDEFSRESLSDETLLSFEKRAEQKFEDLDDYLNIFLNAELEQEFRLQVENMLKASFRSENYWNEFVENLELEEDTQNVLLVHPEVQNKIFVEIDFLRTSKRLQANSNQKYSGEVQFSQKVFEIIKADTILLRDTKGHIEIFAEKSLKEFGPNKKEVWEICFGGVK